MSVKEEVTRLTTYVGACDQCGQESKWTSSTSCGYEMQDPRPFVYTEENLWFHNAECVHKWIEDHVIAGSAVPV